MLSGRIWKQIPQMTSLEIFETLSEVGYILSGHGFFSFFFTTQKLVFAPVAPPLLSLLTQVFTDTTVRTLLGVSALT